MAFSRSILGFTRNLINLNSYRPLQKCLSTESGTTGISSTSGSSGPQSVAEYEATTSNDFADDHEDTDQFEEKSDPAANSGENHPFKIAKARNYRARGWQPTVETHSLLEINGVPYSQLKTVYVSSTKNNTILNLVDVTGTTLISVSAGAVGFKNSKKSTAIAGQAVGLAMSDHVKRRGIKDIKVMVKGFGNGRLPAIKALQMANLNIISITDRTAIPLSFAKPPRPPVPRRI